MFRFSLRAVFVVTLLAAISIAVIHGYVRPYRLQALYIERHEGQPVTISADSVGPKWLHTVFGELASVRGLTVTSFESEDGPAVAAMTDLEFLTLGGTIDDAIAPCLRELSKLIKVDAMYSFVSFQALSHLPNPERVRELKLGVNTDDDDLVEILGKFSGLTTLDLHATQVSDRGLQAVAKCTQLKELSLEGRPISADGLSHLSSLKNLQTLHLHWCDQLGPKTFEVLSSFPALDGVELSNNYLSSVQRRQILQRQIRGIGK